MTFDSCDVCSPGPPVEEGESVGEAYINPGTNSGVMLSSLVRSERPTYTSMAQIPVAPFLTDIAKTIEKVGKLLLPHTSCFRSSSQ